VRIPFNMIPVIASHIRPVTAFDRIGTTVDYQYQDNAEQSADYVFGGVLIPPTDNDLQYFEEGELRQGSMVLYVFGNRTLYFNDIANPTDSTTQTFVRDGTDVYRVKGRADRLVDGLYKKYALTRFINRQ